MKEPPLILVGGPSGAGKTEVVTRLVKEHPSTYQRPTSYSTRLPRPGESSSEYAFITRSEMLALRDNDLLANLDEAYGNLYGMSRDSIIDLKSRGISPIKEVHPSRFANLRASFPGLITVLILPSGKRLQTSLRAERMKADERYYDKVDMSNFDIIRRTFATESVSEIAESVHHTLQCLISQDEEFPRPPVIDDLNSSGYSAVAAEFSETLRPTTASFHQLSQKFWRRMLSAPQKLGTRFLELGPGSGWLRSSFQLGSVEYKGVDISSKMASRYSGKEVFCGSARDLNFPSGYFDVVLASLGDPYCYPTALREIARVLRRGGRFFLTTPAKAWTKVMREDPHVTSFRLENGSAARVYSFVFDMDELVNLLSVCGFQVIEGEVATFRDLSPGQVIPAVLADARAQLESEDFSILNMVCCSLTEKIGDE